MTSIADFKRALQIGVMVHTIFHKERAGRDKAGKVFYMDRDMGVRPVSIIQSNSFAFKTTRANGETVDSWCNWPKKSETVFNPDGSITILEEDQTPVLTYKIINQ